MDELLQSALLYDFYGELLTQKQKQVYELYHQNDWSLSEIAQELSISRQAVRDQLKRTEKILQEYEKKLQLVSMFLEQKNALWHITSIIAEIKREENLSFSSQKKIETIEKIADEIIG